MTNANEPAYPANAVRTENGAEWRDYVPGLTKREAFAMAAMQGLLAVGGRTHGQYSQEDWNRNVPQAEALWVTQSALRYADAMLRELEKTP